MDGDAADLAGGDDRREVAELALRLEGFLHYKNVGSVVRLGFLPPVNFDRALISESIVAVRW